MVRIRERREESGEGLCEKKKKKVEKFKRDLGESFEKDLMSNRCPVLSNIKLIL